MKDEREEGSKLEGKQSNEGSHFRRPADQDEEILPQSKFSS